MGPFISFEIFGHPLASHGVSLEDLLDHSWALLEFSWGLGSFEAPLGFSGDSLGPLVGPLVGTLWPHLGLSWESLGSKILTRCAKTAPRVAQEEDDNLRVLRAAGSGQQLQQLLVEACLAVGLGPPRS